MAERPRYSDDRIDDQFKAIWRAINNLPDRMTVVEAELHSIRDDTAECKDGVVELHKALVKRSEQREREREERRVERKADRRWIVATILTASGLVIAALGLLLGKIG